MNPAAPPEMLVDWLEQELLAEVSDPFSLLRKIPDTSVILRLDQYFELDAAAQSSWRRTLAGWSACNLCGLQPNPRFAEYQAVCSLSGLNTGLRYTGVNLLAGLRRDPAHASLDEFFRQRGTSERAMQLPTEIVELDDPLEPATPAMVRRQVKAALTQLFDAQIKDMGSEIFRYAGILNDQPIAVDVRYSARMGRAQMGYSVAFTDRAIPKVACSLNYELVLGIGMGHWDYLTRKNLPSCIQTFCDCLNRLSRLPRRMPAV